MFYFFKCTHLFKCNYQILIVVVVKGTLTIFSNAIIQKVIYVTNCSLLIYVWIMVVILSKPKDYKWLKLKFFIVSFVTEPLRNGSPSSWPPSWTKEQSDSSKEVFQPHLERVPVSVAVSINDWCTRVVRHRSHFRKQLRTKVPFYLSDLFLHHTFTTQTKSFWWKKLLTPERSFQEKKEHSL